MNGSTCASARGHVHALARAQDAAAHDLAHDVAVVDPRDAQHDRAVGEEDVVAGPDPRASSGSVVETRCASPTIGADVSVSSPPVVELDLVVDDRPGAHLRARAGRRARRPRARARPRSRAPARRAARARRRLPCAALSRTTSAPAASSARIVSGSDVAGPTVATIFVRRIPRTITRLASSRGPHPHLRASASWACTASCPRNRLRPQPFEVDVELLVDAHGRGRERRSRRHRRLRRGVRSGQPGRVVRAATSCSNGSRRASPRCAAPIRASSARSSRCASCIRRCARCSTTSRCASSGEPRVSRARFEPRRPRRASAVRGRRARTRADGVDVVAVSRVYETAPVGGPPQDAYLNAVVAIDTDLDPHALLALAQRIERDAAARARRTLGPAHARRRRACCTTTSGSTTPTSRCRIPRMWERGFVLAPLRDVAPALVDAAAAVGRRARSGGNIAHSMAEQQRTVALIGPGRAGTTIALGLLEQGWTVVGVAGRAPDAPSTTSAAACLASRPALVSEVGARRRARDRRDARPGDRAGAADRRTRRSNRARSSCTSRVRAASTCSRRCSNAGPGCGSARCTRCSRSRRRRSGSSASPARGPRSRAIPRSPTSPASLGLRPFELADSDRGRYHAAAVVASNHLVALLGQVERLAATCAVPFEAFAPLVLGVGAERLRARPGRRADRTGRPRRPRAPSNSTCAISTRPSATRTAPSPGKPPG